MADDNDNDDIRSADDNLGGQEDLRVKQSDSKEYLLNSNTLFPPRKRGS